LANEIIRLLTEDGRMPIGEMAKGLPVIAPTVRIWIKCLDKKGLFIILSLAKPERHQDMMTTFIAIDIEL
jgi:hypothetical protein